MDFQIDPKLLFQNLLALPKAPALNDLPAELDYLMKALVEPIMAEEEIDLGEIDFDSFELEDLDSLERFLDQQTTGQERLRKLKSSFIKIPAVPVSLPIFC